MSHRPPKCDRDLNTEQDRYLASFFTPENGDMEQLFVCWADDSAHAWEQCMSAYPNAYDVRIYFLKEQDS